MNIKSIPNEKMMHKISSSEYITQNLSEIREMITCFENLLKLLIVST